MPVTTPPRRPETEHDRDLDRRVTDLEALIEEARRRARRRRIGIGVALIVVATGAAGVSDFFRGGGGAGASVVGDSGANGRLIRPAASLAPLPKGNEAQAFAFDPRRPNVVYAESRDARGGVYVFKTTDGAQHWRLTGARGNGWKSDILSLTADPQQTGTLYAGTDTAVYKTVDGGRSWKPFRRGLFPRQHKRCYSWVRSTVRTRQCIQLPYGTPGTPSWNRNNGWVLDLAVDPTHRSIVYAAAGAVRKSTDGGRTWKAVLQPSWKSSVTRIAIAPTRPESIYAIAHGPTGGTAIYKSTNAGRTWQRTGGSSGLPPSCCGDSEDALAVDQANSQTVYAAVGDTVLATTDGGASWRPIANGLPAHDVTFLAVDPQRSGTAYASVMVNLNRAKPNTVYKTAGAIYKTTDGGQTWSEVFSSIGVGTIAVDPARPSTIYAAGWALADKTHDDKMRVLKSTNGGRTWAVSR